MMPRGAFFALLLLGLVGPASAAEVRLLERARVAQSLVRLGDVAEVRGDDAAALRAIPLMPRPAEGSLQYVSAAAVRDMLAAQGVSRLSYRFSGAYRVRIESNGADRPRSQREVLPTPPPTSRTARTAFRVRSGVTERAVPTRIARRTVSPTERRAVEQAVRDALQREIDAERSVADSSNRLAVTEVAMSTTALRELSEMLEQPLRTKFTGVGTLGAGKVQASVWPEARLGGEPFKVAITLREQPMRTVAAIATPRGTLLTRSAVRLEPIPLEELESPRAVGFTEVDRAIGLEATRDLRAGEVLSPRNTAAPLMVRRGDEVEVVAGGGGVFVTTSAVAQQDGRQGELIKVETLSHEAELTARVVGPRRLAITLADPAIDRYGSLQ